MKRDWIVAQIGAREHYAAARALQQEHALERLYTEFWSANPRLLKRAPAPLRALAGRHHDGVPRAKVTAFSGATLGAAARDFVGSRLARGARDIESDYREFARVGEEFARRCVADLEKRDLNGARSAFFGYNTGCLETLIWLRERGVPTVVGQIDPARVEEDLVRAESEKWPGWAALPGRIPDLYYARLRAEWEAATRVLVNSPWSRDALIEQGVAPEKIVVVPLAYEPETTATTSVSATQTRAENAPLRVLWLGSVLLRKGIQYLLEAARILRDENIRFIVAGPLYIGEDKAASAPPNVEFRGRVARDEAAQLYQNADLFVLPTLSDGFAITQIEAMAHGLPVIATARCGEVVTPGTDGEIVPVGDGAALASAIQNLNSDRARLRAMSAAARQKSRQFGLDRFAAGLMAALD